METSAFNWIARIKPICTNGRLRGWLLSQSAKPGVESDKALFGFTPSYLPQSRRSAVLPAHVYVKPWIPQREPAVMV
jgi:hypothetical protein